VSLPSPAELLAFAEEIALHAGEITLQYFGSRVEHQEKGDGTPVTLADRAAEEALRRRITERYPEHGILGEEFGEKEGRAPVRWILDPIDGTRSFMRGVPLYAVLIGVEVEEEPVVGVAHFPGLSETVAAARGRGCRWNGRPCGVSSQADWGGPWCSPPIR
jgi:histidinol-phosphatase